MARHRLLVGLALALFPVTLAAQEAPRTITQMILGAGPIAGGSSPAYNFGFEIKPAGSRVALRLMTEFWESSYHHCYEPPCDNFAYSSNDAWGQSRTFGIQALGVRTFGTRRFQPYFFAGAGLYSSRAFGSGRQFVLTDSGVYSGTPLFYERSEVVPAMIWGTGFNVRIWRANLLGEVRLPLWSGNALGFRHGPQAPLILGIRF